MIWTCWLHMIWTFWSPMILTCWLHLIWKYWLYMIWTCSYDPSEGELSSCIHGKERACSRWKGVALVPFSFLKLWWSNALWRKVDERQWSGTDAFKFHILPQMPNDNKPQHRHRLGTVSNKLLQYEPAHEILILFVLRKPVLKMRMRSHPVGLDAWFLVRHFVYFHTSCVRTAKAVERLCRWAGSPDPSLVAYVISTMRPKENIFVFQVSWPYLGFWPDPKHFIVKKKNYIQNKKK